MFIACELGSCAKFKSGCFIKLSVRLEECGWKVWLIGGVRIMLSFKTKRFVLLEAT
jgi:hypothetical protein